MAILVFRVVLGRRVYHWNCMHIGSGLIGNGGFGLSGDCIFKNHVCAPCGLKDALTWRFSELGNALLEQLERGVVRLCSIRLR